MVEWMKANLGGRRPKRMTLDNGYYGAVEKASTGSPLREWTESRRRK